MPDSTTRHAQTILDGLLTVDRAARRYGLSEMSIRRHIQRGAPVHTVLSGVTGKPRMMIDPESFERWLALSGYSPDVRRRLEMAQVIGGQ